MDFSQEEKFPEEEFKRGVKSRLNEF